MIPPPSAARSASSVRAHGLRRTLATISAVAIGDWPSAVDNSLLRELVPDESGKPPQLSREVRGAHYVSVRPSVPAPAPRLVAYSSEVASSLGLSAETCESDEFLQFFAGKVPEAVPCWATSYGASFAGRYGGQRGDGRAISVGQVNGLEVQLKGAGTTPFSRRFDGRAVLRSSVREFLASEAMHHLGVPTTRALAVVASGDTVQRAWYDSQGRERVGLEPGAVGARVAPSFLRFGQFELFYQRDEPALLRALAVHALGRDFAHLRLQEPEAPLSRLLVLLFREVCERQARLVAEWLRVGYCQGNMNSDNSALCGVTLDYGPFGFLERFDPMHCPWVGGGAEYSFGRQPQAAAINLSILSEAWADLLRAVATEEGLTRAEADEAVQQTREGVSSVFVDAFHATHDEHNRRKLGLVSWDDDAAELWTSLFGLMATRSGPQGIDFTVFFRSLGDLTNDLPDGGDGLAAARAAAIGGAAEWPQEHLEAWREWAARYWGRVGAEARPDGERRREMAAANPKYILRNWMLAEAYEAAERGDSSAVHALHALLRSPYEEQPSADPRYAQPTPDWARGRPGLAFMS